MLQKEGGDESLASTANEVGTLKARFKALKTKLFDFIPKYSEIEKKDN